MKNSDENLPLVNHYHKPQKMANVNLDALIKREDLYIIGKSEDTKVDIDRIRLDADLTPKSLLWKTLRKPDFQRITSEWKPERIAGLIKSFLNKDIIPSIIIWHSPTGNNFIIDGAHRLSALIAWVRNDYGDGALSESYFGKRNIPAEQYKMAKKTRDLINREVGSYESYDMELIDETTADPNTIRIAKSLAVLYIQVQTIDTNSPEAAEQSFFKINGEATPISDTEALILKSRKKPNSIAARAIINAGTGHKYWQKFGQSTQDQVEDLARKINSLLFEPKYETPIVTIDLPLAGKGYSAYSLELVFNLVNLSNDLKLGDWKRLKVDTQILPTDDSMGEDTVQYLRRTKRIIDTIAGKEKFSLGLSPVIYFYSLEGRYQVTPFLAVVELIKYFEKDTTKDMFFKFTLVRGDFEKFLRKYKVIVKQAVGTIGSGLKSYLKLYKVFLTIIEMLIDGKEEESIKRGLLKNAEFASFLKFDEPEIKPNKRKDFNTDTKGAINIKARLENPLLCPYCGGHIFSNSQNIDHTTDVKHGGLGEVDNGTISHWYCNSSKDKILDYRKKHPK